MDSVKQPIIDLIHEVLSGAPPIFVDGGKSQDKARLANQLIEGGYLAGDAATGNVGQVLQVAILDVTIKGREYCDELEKEIRDSRLSVKTGKTIKKGLLLLLGAIGGTILTVATQWLLTRLNLK